MPVLHGWENFYAIVGASAGALVGLQFVMVTLIAMSPVDRRQGQASHAFVTPTVVHFSLVLLLAAIATAPLESATTVAALWGAVGLGGVVYSLIVARRMRAQTGYAPVLEDWLTHFLAPGAGYAAIAGAAVPARADVRTPAFVVAVASLGLLFVGVRNAWDSVTYFVFVRQSEPPKP